MDVETRASNGTGADDGARGGTESDILLEMDPNSYALSAEELASRINALNRESDFMHREAQRLKYEQRALAAEMNDNQRKIAMYRQLPYLVANVVEVLDLEPEKDEDGVLLDSDAQVGKGVVIKTSDRKVIIYLFIYLLFINSFFFFSSYYFLWLLNSKPPTQFIYLIVLIYLSVF